MQAVSKTLQNHPNVIVFPPVILATTLVLACMLQWLWPLGALANMSQGWRIAIGCLLVLAGVPQQVGAEIDVVVQRHLHRFV